MGKLDITMEILLLNTVQIGLYIRNIQSNFYNLKMSYNAKSHDEYRQKVCALHFKKGAILTE